jgi:hypothetical protein
VVVWDPINEREIVLLTNLLHFGPTTIAAIYKDRWEIELFFGSPQEFVRSGILRGFPDFLKSDVFSVGHSHALRFQ